MAVRPSDQPEVLQAYFPNTAKHVWCDRCEMGHPNIGCPPIRPWWVNLVSEEGRRLTYRAVGQVAARSAWSALELAVLKFGEIPRNGQRLAVDTADYIRTVWDRLLDDDLGI